MSPKEMPFPAKLTRPFLVDQRTEDLQNWCEKLRHCPFSPSRDNLIDFLVGHRDNHKKHAGKKRHSSEDASTAGSSGDKKAKKADPPKKADAEKKKKEATSAAARKKEANLRQARHEQHVAQKEAAAAAAREKEDDLRQARHEREVAQQRYDLATVTLNKKNEEVATAKQEKIRTSTALKVAEKNVKKLEREA